MARPTVKSKTRKSVPGAPAANQPKPRLRDAGTPRTDKIGRRRSDTAAADAREPIPAPKLAQATATQASAATALPADIVALMTAPDWLADMFPGDTWAPWITFLKAVFALPMTADELAFYGRMTGRAAPPERRARELLALMGRRSGKTKALALILLWYGVFVDWRSFTSKGDQLMVALVAATKDQAGIALGYLRAMFEHAALARLVEAEDAESITLTTGMVLSVKAGSFRTIRGWKIPCALIDEAAFFYDGEASTLPLSALLEALTPAQAEFGEQALLMAATSPYGRTGWTWSTFEANFGRGDADVLVWQAPTWEMNPRVTRESLEKHFRRDPNSAGAEYGAQFRDINLTFVSAEALGEVIAQGVRERPITPGKSYVGFIDMASGTGTDSLTFAIAHREKDGVGVLDVLREIRAPFNAEHAIRDEIAPVARRYGIRIVKGDKYGAGMAIDLLRRHGLTLEYCDRDRSSIYVEMLGVINTKFCSLLDNDRMREQFIGLERRNGRNRDVVDHRSGEHDDLANAAAGAIVEVAVIGDDGSARAVQHYAQMGSRERDSSSPWGLAEPAPLPEIAQAIRGAIAQIEHLEREEGIASWYDARTRSMQCRGPTASEALRALWQTNTAEYREHLRNTRIGPPGPDGTYPAPIPAATDSDDPTSPEFRAAANATLRGMMARTDPRGSLFTVHSPLGIPFDPTNWRPKW